jgi:hypothetical protein
MSDERLEPGSPDALRQRRERAGSLPESPSGFIPMFRRVAHVTGMPRSGTSWLAQMLAAHPDVRLKLSPLFSHEFKERIDDRATSAEWRAFLAAVYATPSDYMDQAFLRRAGAVPAFVERRESPSVLAIKSTRHHHFTRHLLDVCPEILWFAIVRHPCAAIHSWLANPREFPASADPLTEWCSGGCRKNHPAEFWGFDDWMLVTTLFVDLARQYPDRFLLIRYEALVAEPETWIRSLLTSLDLDLHPQVTAFIRESQSRHSEDHRSVFKSPARIDRWRHELDPRIRCEIEARVADSRLACFLDPPESSPETAV